MARRSRRPSTARGTRNLPSSAFAYPKTRQYPINTPRRARNALARAAQKGTSGTYQHVARAVRRRYGNRIASVGRARGRTTGPGMRRRRGSSGTSAKSRSSTRRRSTSRRRTRSRSRGRRR